MFRSLLTHFFIFTRQVFVETCTKYLAFFMLIALGMLGGAVAGYAAGRMFGGYGYGYGWGRGSWGSCSWGSRSWGSFSGGSWGSFGGFD
jgi:hypothetical protein